MQHDVALLLKKTRTLFKKAAFALACLEGGKIRNEEAIHSTKQDLLAKGFSLPTLSSVKYSSGYLLFISDDRKYVFGRRLYAYVYK